MIFRKAYQEREQQFMEDKKRKKEEKRKRENSQKVAEQKKVPELTKPTSAQSPASPSSVSPNSSPAAAAAGPPPQGGNNAKRPAVANGQPPSSSAPVPQRYMPREVPPRFRCQQDHKVLLKRGQPPLSCMLLGGGSGGGGSPLSQGDASGATTTAVSDSSPGAPGPAPSSLTHPSSTSPSVAASSTTTSSNYANSTWGASSGSQPLSQGWEKVIVDRSDLEEWPSIAAGAGAGAGTGDGAGVAPNSSSSASWSDRPLQQQQKGAGPAGKGGGSGSPSPPSSSGSPGECTQPVGGVWGSAPLAGSGGIAAASSAPSKSKAGPLPGTLEGSAGGGGSPGANFNPSANPAAWPALVQDGTSGGEGSTPPPLNQPPSSASPSAHQHLHQMQGEWAGAGPETGTGPKKAGEEEPEGVTGGGGDAPPSSSSSTASSSSSSWRAQPLSSDPKAGSSRTDPAWDNQKGAGEVGGVAETGEWGGSGRVGTSSSSGGGHSRAGSGGAAHNQHHGHAHHHRAPNPEAALQSLLSRTDLDPRVLSNTGWGQTQIRQNVAWDLEASSGGGNSSSASNTAGLAPPYTAANPPTTDLSASPSLPGGPKSGPNAAGDGWESGNNNNGGSARGPGVRNAGPPQPGAPGHLAGPQGKSSGGHQTQIPNSQSGMMKPSGPLQPPPSVEPGGWAGKPGGPINQNQNQSSGWCSGPVPRLSGEASEPSGWEEPSPQSISRKMEIDDGTSAWGDPNHYNYKSVNLWDKNGAPSGQPPPQPSGPQQPPKPPGSGPAQPPPGRPAHQHGAPGNRDMNPGHMPGKPSGMVWGGGGPPPPSPSVDNGTAGWGKPTDTHSGWGDPEDSGKASGWGNLSPNPIKSGAKSMQEGWGEGEGSVSASRHSSWEEEEEGAGVWSSAGSQGSSSSYNSGGWGQGPWGKKGNSKGALKGGGGDSWMNPMTRQFSNMALLGEDPSGRSLDLAPGPPQDKKLEGDKRGMSLSDYNGEIRKGGRGGAGGGGGTVFRSPSSKDVGPGEPGPYYDKTGGHGMFGGSGGMAQSRGVHQPGVPPINPSPGIRAQVPHQFLSPQLPSSMLKQMPPPSSGVGGVGGVAGGVFPPQLSPQHIAMLSSIYPPHIQFQLACQLLLQQQQPQQQILQNQRKFPQNIRPQPDPQQVARIMALFQQQRQQQQGGGPGGGSKLSPSHLGGVAPKPTMADPLSHPGLGGTLADLHSKAQGGGYSGFGSGVNLSGLEMGSMVGGPGGMKDSSGGQQSRFKWIMEGHSPAPSPPDSALHKNGPISAPVKLRGSSPYSQYELLGGDGLGVPPQGPSDNWHRTPGNKMGTKTGSSSWPPEFQPGVPWKGIQSADPESDPYMTPGSVLGSSGTSGLNDTEHQLLRDNPESNPSLNTLLPSPGAWPYSASDSPLNNAHNSAKYTEYKPSWPPDPIGHNKPWKANRNSSQMPRPPPGLSHQKQPALSSWAGGGPRLARGWGGSSGGQDSRYGPGSAWSDAGASRGSCWLVLSNLTPQIDGSTLRTICMQHGPLLTFHLGLTQGSALICYSSRQEAAKAQSALHMCVLGNTTILAEFVSEEEVARYFAHSQAGGSGSGGGAGAAPGAGGGQGPSGTGAVGAGGGAGGSGSTPGGERERAVAAGGAPGGGAGGAGAGGNGGGAGASTGSVGPPGSAWQSLDGSGSTADPSATQGPGLSIFAQWSSNGGGAAGVGGGTGGVEPGRQGLWGAMTPGYPSSSLWGAPSMEDRHQMGSPASLLPGDLLGGGTDSI
ncbi:hypothetical protein GJAV_G00143390 [Gymnothorax javanicus]|nr:hypothetical protein GJAV_G00143390 [Gymnothorax javanicus]